MSTAKAKSKVRLLISENKWGRSNKRHFARKNRRKKTFDGYEHEKKPRKLILSRFTGDGWMPCPKWLHKRPRMGFTSQGLDRLQAGAQSSKWRILSG
jgi:hypothetical protein